jgi:hypothetical protein
MYVSHEIIDMTACRFVTLSNHKPLKTNSMARLTGPLQFTGSVGTIRSYYDKRLKCYILSTKGGASRELILHNPNLARTRDNMNEFTACSMWASRLRKALSSMVTLYRGSYFSNIVSYGKNIQKFDTVNKNGKRSVESSKAPHLLKLINFNVDEPFDMVFCYPFNVSFSDDKKRVTLQISGFQSYGQLHWISGFQSYRFTLVILQLADMVWNETERRYKPSVAGLERLSVTTVSDWYDRSTEKVDINLEASFAEPALQQPGTTVAVALGIEVSGYSTKDLHFNVLSGTMRIVECFVL